MKKKDAIPIGILITGVSLTIIFILASTYGSLRPYTTFGYGERADAFEDKLTTSGYKVVHVLSFSSDSSVQLESETDFLDILRRLNTFEVYRSQGFYVVDWTNNFSYRYFP